MLSKIDIEKQLGKEINIYPLHSDNIKENSINLTIGRNAWALGSGTVVCNEQNRFILAGAGNSGNKHPIVRGGSAIIASHKKHYLVLLPHVTTVVETSEVIGVGNHIGGTLHSKVGVVAHGIGDIGTMLGPNFCGHLMISLHNVTDEVVTLMVGDTFASLVFHYLDTPSSKAKNPNISGHVDKLAELGVNIDASTRKYLTQDWKCSVDGVREKMCASTSYRLYKKQIAKNNWRSLLSYLTIRNAIIVIMGIAVTIGLGFLASYIDTRTGKTLWTERFWTVVLSGIIIPSVMSVRKLFQKR